MLLIVLFPSSAETNVGWNGKLHGYLFWDTVYYISSFCNNINCYATKLHCIIVIADECILNKYRFLFLTKPAGIMDHSTQQIN